jgi:AcrR family transcriptional regulator
VETTPRERLLDAVIEVALADGIADKSLRAIAEAAGTSHRMLIHHFGSKERLFVEIIQAVEAHQRATLDRLSGSEDAAPQELFRFWQQLRSPKLAPQERLFFEIYGQALQGREWATPLFDGIVENWVAPLAVSLEEGGLGHDAARATARLCVAVSRGLLLDVLATGEYAEADAAMQLFLRMLHGQRDSA